jgi:hypothetical protein
MRHADLDDVADHNYKEAVACERKELEQLLSPKWMPIETAPIDDCEWIILGHPDYFVPEIGYFNKRHNVWCSSDDRILFNGTPTHWMKIPASPERNMT